MVRIGDVVKFFRGPPWFKMQVVSILEGPPTLVIVKRGSYMCVCAPIALKKVETVVNSIHSK